MLNWSAYEIDWNWVAWGWLVVLFGFHLSWGVELMRGNRSLRYVKDLPDTGSGGRAGLPRLTVLVPARNEADTIEKGLTSLLTQDYPNYRIIAINDRSDDGTGEILETMAREHSEKATAPFLEVCHITELPPGWLGKNHALWIGAEMALSDASENDFLLFTDADIVMEPSVLSRTVRYALDNGYDHLTILPEMDVTGLVLNTFMGAFTQFFAMYARPWKARDPKSSDASGVGAFNLVRLGAYQRCGTHRAIAMRVDDDVRLARILKRNGARQDALLGFRTVRVDWYPSLPAMIDGLKKNAFAGVDFNVPTILAGFLFYLLFQAGPFFMMLGSDGLYQGLTALLVIWIACYYRDNARIHGVKPLPALLCGLTFPLSAMLMGFILVLSMAVTLKNKGVIWRGTWYSIQSLKGEGFPGNAA